jgi:hypothetical protein
MSGTTNKTLPNKRRRALAKTEKEICSLIDTGFEYVTEFQGGKIFRKRKF